MVCQCRRSSVGVVTRSLGRRSTPDCGPDKNFVPSKVYRKLLKSTKSPLQWYLSSGPEAKRLEREEYYING